MDIDGQSSPTLGRVYSARQISVATFLGGPLAAGWLFHRNYVVLGDRSLAERPLWIGLVSTVGLLAVGFLLPPHFPSVLLPILSVAAAQALATWCFKEPYEKRSANGGASGSWWMVVGISLISLLAIVGMVFAIVSLIGRAHGT